MSTVFVSDFDLGEMVYLLTDEEQRRWIVCGVDFHLSGAVLYRLICGTIESHHCAQEMSREKSVEALAI